MKLICLAFQKKYLDVKILNGGSCDLKYKMAAKFLGIRQCLPDDLLAIKIKIIRPQK